MKYLKPFLFLALLVVITITGSQASTSSVSGFVALPDPIKTAIDALFVLGVSALLTLAVTKFAWLSFLLPFAREWGLALASAVIPWIENYLPGGVFAEAGILFVQFVLAVIAGVLAINKAFARRDARLNA